MSRKVIVNNTLWAGMDVGISFLFTMIGSVTIARALGPSKLGYYNFIFWVANLTGQLAAFGVPAATRKYAAEYLGREEPGVARRIVTTTLQFQFCSALVVLLGGLAITFAFVSDPHRVYTIIAVVSLLPYMLGSIFGSANAAAEDFSASFLGSTASNLVGLAGILLSLARGWDLVGLAAALFASRIADVSVRAYLFHRRFPRAQSRGQDIEPDRHLTPELRRRIIRFSVQASVLLLTHLVVWDRSEMFFLKMFSDPRQIAFYSLGFGITQQLLYIPYVFASATAAAIMVEAGRKESRLGRLTGNTLRYLSILVPPMILGTAVLSSPVIHVLYGERYYPAVPVLSVLAIFMLPRVGLMTMQPLLIAADRQALVVKWGLTCAVLNIAMDVLLIPRGAALGAAWANGIAQLVNACGLWYLSNKHFTIDLPMRLVVRTVASSAIMGAGVWAAIRPLPPLAGVVIGIPLGAAIYILSLRLTRCLDDADRERFLSLQSRLPLRSRAAYAAAVRFVAPPISPDSLYSETTR